MKKTSVKLTALGLSGALALGGVGGAADQPAQCWGAAGMRF